MSLLKEEGRGGTTFLLIAIWTFMSKGKNLSIKIEFKNLIPIGTSCLMSKHFKQIK